jgi:hypothetical protein
LRVPFVVPKTKAVELSASPSPDTSAFDLHLANIGLRLLAPDVDMRCDTIKLLLQGLVDLLVTIPERQIVKRRRFTATTDHVGLTIDERQRCADWR